MLGRIAGLPRILECVCESVAVAICHADRFANGSSDWSCKKDFAFAVDFLVEIAGVHGGGRAAAYVDRAVAYESGNMPYRIPTSPRTMIWF